jgi:hypothetical protein
LAHTAAIFSLLSFSTLATLWLTGATCCRTYFFVAQPKLASINAIAIAIAQLRLCPDLIMYPLCGLYGDHRSETKSLKEVTDVFGLSSFSGSRTAVLVQMQEVHSRFRIW